MPVRNVVTMTLAAIISLICYEQASHNRYAKTIVHAMQIVEDNYVEEVGPRQLFENAMTGMVGQLDEYSAYIGPRFFERFQQSIDQEFVGIGIIVEGPPQTERLTVVTPVFDSPAFRSGLRAGDVIVKIDGFPSETLDVDRAVERIRGPAGSKVALTVRHVGEDQPVTIDVMRDTIRTKSVLGDTRRPDGQWNYFLRDHPRIGYVRLTTFGELSVEELDEVLEFQDHKIDALILDLRRNAGGLLGAAVSTCEFFIDEGVIVSTRGRRPVDQETIKAEPGKPVFDPTIPMVVLIDRFSASASEIVAACLKDHNRATIVGQRSWGKGTVQNVIPLEGGKSALKLTTASYWRPNGQNIHRRPDATDDDDWGVRPSPGCEVVLDPERYRQVIEQRRERDVLRAGEAPSTTSDAAVAPIDDPQLDKAIEVLQSRLAAPAT